MAVINIRSLDSKHIVLEKNNKPFGQIKYEGFFNQRVQVISTNNEIYDFVRTSIWKDTYELRQGNEIFMTCKMGLLGKVKIFSQKTGTEFELVSKSILNKKFSLSDNTGALLFTLSVKYGFLVSIKEGVMETTGKFDNMNEQLLLCAAVIFSIDEQIKKTVIITS